MGQMLGFSINLLRRPYNTLALPCECVIKLTCICDSRRGLLLLLLLSKIMSELFDKL